MGLFTRKSDGDGSTPEKWFTFLLTVLPLLLPVVFQNIWDLLLHFIASRQEKQLKEEEAELAAKKEEEAEAKRKRLKAKKAEKTTTVSKPKKGSGK